MKIYTKTGDKGYTSLFGGQRVEKHHVRLEAYGTLDELLSYMGLIRDFTNRDTKESIVKIQNTLFNIGSHLATPIDNDKAKSKLPEISLQDVEFLEMEMDRMEENIPAMTNFVLPGGHPNVSHCHIARTICRRCERRISSLAEIEDIDSIPKIYVNRLSDYLFMLSRHLTVELNVEEIFWIPK
ncbi:MAG: cob(I)yrinic acid a,c-diamide adenosyltransferase [Flavobacteriales bacterium]|nr:cob(I)yrinic acid a,c-diamide adenosyltransferase [Flavobacteriales bacterium]